MDRRTKAYYDSLSREYFISTADFPVAEALNEFLSLVRKGGRILDCGSGPGRDTKYFLSLGYETDMIDISEPMCCIASEYTGKEAVCMDYMDLTPSVLYSGIWAQASLLHERRENLKRAFSVLSSCLEEKGILYASFRYGRSGRREGERWYTDMTPDTLMSVLPPSLAVIRTWTSTDVRPGFSYRWLNVLLRKVE